MRPKLTGSVRQVVPPNILRHANLRSKLCGGFCAGKASLASVGDDAICLADDSLQPSVDPQVRGDWITGFLDYILP